MSHAGMNTMSAATDHSVRNQGAGARLELHSVTVSNLICSMVALTAVLATLTPLGWDSLWVAPIAGLAALAIQLTAPVPELNDAAGSDS